MLGDDLPVALDISRAAARGSASSMNSAPPQLQSQLHAIVAGDSATATQDVLTGMAIAPGIAFLLAIRFPHRRPRSR
jgi:hypothetical protein